VRLGAKASESGDGKGLEAHGTLGFIEGDQHTFLRGGRKPKVLHLKPKTFYDFIVEIAIVRPRPAGHEGLAKESLQAWPKAQSGRSASHGPITGIGQPQ
jgi:hypothetical protein